MQKIPLQRNTGSIFRSHLTCRSIKRVSHNWVPQRSKMHSNLMGTSSVDLDFKQAEFTERRIDPAFHSVMRNGLPSAVSSGRHARSPHEIPAYSIVDGSTVLFEPPVYQRDVSFLNNALGKLLG